MEAMTDYTTRTKERIDRSSGVRPDRIYIGKDSDGDEHHYLTTEEAVVVVSEDGTRLWRQPLSAENPIEAWVVHIGDRRGWVDQRLYQSFGDAMADAVEVHA